MVETPRQAIRLARLAPEGNGLMGLAAAWAMDPEKAVARAVAGAVVKAQTVKNREAIRPPPTAASRTVAAESRQSTAGLWTVTSLRVATS